MTATASTSKASGTKSGSKKTATSKRTTSAKAAPKKPAAKRTTSAKAAPKKPAAKRTTSAKAAPKAKQSTTAADNGGSAKSIAAVEGGVRVWFERLSDFQVPSWELPSFELPSLDLPTIELPEVELPSRDDVRVKVVQVLDDIQDAVMTAPNRAQEIVVDLRESVTKSVVLIREAAGI